MKISSVSILVMASVFTLPSFGKHQYNASDVIKYALTSHGAQYLLQDRKGAVNAWDSKRRKTVLRNYKKVKGIWGNTDCSALVSAAFRYKRYSKPKQRNKPRITTLGFHNLGKRHRQGFKYLKGKNHRNIIRHGDALNRRVKNAGHIVLFNGKLKSGKFSTVEAWCFKCGVGRFTKSWNKFSRRFSYRVLRNNKIKPNVKNSYLNFTVGEASAVRTTLGKVSNKAKPIPQKQPDSSPSESKKPYIVKMNDNGWTIKKKLGVSWSALQKANPTINWRRLRGGEKINVPSSSESYQLNSSTTTRKSYSNYVISRGDSGWKIAKKRGISLVELKRANPSVRWKRLRIGQRIKIPS